MTDFLPLAGRPPLHDRFRGKPGVGYVRLSDAELTLGYSLDAHTEYIRRAAAERGVILIAESGVEDGIIREVASGRKEHRTEQFDLLARLVQEGKISVIICRDQDRWFRNEMKRLDFEARILRPNRVELLFPPEGDIESPAQREFMRSIKGAYAQYYAEQTREKILESLLLKAHRGEYCGGNVPYGHTLEQCGERTNKYGRKRPVHTLAPHPLDSRVVLFMKELYVRGFSDVFSIPEQFHDRGEYGSTLITEILNKLGFTMRNGRPFSTAFVKKQLRDERDHHLGTMTYFETIGDKEQRADLGRSRREEHEIIRVPGAFPAIVPVELQRAAQEKIASSRKRLRFAVRTEYLGSGVYRHLQDGAPMVGRTRTPWGHSRHRELRYMCAHRYNKQGCTAPMLDAEAVHKTAESVFKEFVSSPEILRRVMEAARRLMSEPATPTPPPQEIEQRRQELVRQKGNLINNMKEAPDVARILGHELRKIQAELDWLEAQSRHATESAKRAEPEIEDPKEVLQRLREGWERSSIREKNRILKRFIREANIDTERGTVQYRLGVPISLVRPNRPELAGLDMLVQQGCGGG